MKHLIAAFLLLGCGSVQAELIERAGGAAYYDDVLNITWLADAGSAMTAGFNTQASSVRKG